MVPFADALKAQGLETEISVMPVLSGYPTPKYVNLVVRRVAGKTFLFECSANRTDIIEQVQAGLDERGVDKLDALLVTHCHGDHGGSSNIISKRGYQDGGRAPIYVHSSGYRYLTQPDATFLHETYEIFLSRSQWGLREYNTLSDDEIIENALRKRYSGYFDRTPKSALRFVDQGQIPPGILAVPTPGHSVDCVLYFDAALGVAIPGDTIITTGKPEDPTTWAYVVPIFTVLGQAYSEPYENYLRTIIRLRRFFETHEVRMVIPPHGRFAVTRPLEWVTFAEDYFKGIYRAFLNDFLGDSQSSWRKDSFRASDLNPYIPNAGSHPISTPSHTFGMLCALADEGYLSLREHPHTRQIRFRMAQEPPVDYVESRLAEDPGPVPVYRAGYRLT